MIHQNESEETQFFEYEIIFNMNKMSGIVSFRKNEFLLISYDISLIHFVQFQPYLSSNRKVKFFCP